MKGTVFFEKSRSRWKAELDTPQGKRISKRFKDKANAENWLVAQNNDINKGLFIEPDEITTGYWIIFWLDTYVKNTVKQRTIERYVSLAKHCNEIANIKLQKIQPQEIQRLYVSLQASLSAHTINKVHKVLSAAFKKAYELRMLNINIMQFVKPPKFEKKEIEIFKQEEIKKILSSLKEDRYYEKYYPFFLLAISTGARLGELLGLRWIDFDANKNEIFIRQSIQGSLKGLIRESTKTKAGIRKLSIPQKVAQELLKIGNPTPGDKESLIFQTNTGNPYAPNNMIRAWKKILLQAEVEYKNIHVLRHTHATQLLANSIPIVEVSRRLGHAKTSHTLDLYGQAIPNYDDKIAINISNIFDL